ncbi:MAG: ATP-binding cassette domain-containing protein, partial [Thermoguttaceae bacterium]|nr:ATP-binding cassette domain-containing protein [Thermoguttaceae bacterium]
MKKIPIVSIIGFSGSGKTTLLSVLGCILSPDEGEVEIYGHEIAALDEAQRIEFRRRLIGFVFQRFHLIRGLTALQNVCVPLTIRGMGWRSAERRA